MATSKVLLYYLFTPLEDLTAIKLWQETLCRSLGLNGRILISQHGINGTVGGELDACKIYLKETKRHPAFKKLMRNVKWSEGSGFVKAEEAPESKRHEGKERRAPWRISTDFPRLSVKVRDEIVSFGAPEELEVNKRGVVGGGVHLKPEEVNELVSERGDDVVFFDGRNAWEAEIGKFKDAIVPKVKTSHDFLKDIDSGAYDHIKDKAVITYCTGGVRCEILSAHMKKRGFKEVYQIDGGIVKYGEHYGDSGLWEGSLYIFDKRKIMNFTPEAKVIGKCFKCSSPSSRMENCLNKKCREQLVVCKDHTDTVVCKDHESVVVN